MIVCEFYEDGALLKRASMPAVPRIGEDVITGYGKDYRAMRVVSVTWDTDPPGAEHATARIGLKPCAS